MNTSPKYSFSAPFIPAADSYDGLVRYAELGESLSVEITLWDAIRPGYFFQLILNDQLVGNVWTMTDRHRPGDVITLKLDTRLFAGEGRYTLSFRATNDKSEVSNHSAKAAQIVDRTAPGASLLAQMTFANVSFGDVLVARIPGYAGMAVGDVVQAVCNGMQGPLHRVRAENLTNAPVELSFTKEFIQGVFSDKVNITYHVTDRAGNRSILAQPVEITVQS